MFCSTDLTDCPLFRWLFRDGLLPDNTLFVGFARSNLSVEDIKAACLPHMKVSCLRLLVGLSVATSWLVRGVFSLTTVPPSPQVTDEESESLSAFFSKNSYLSGRYDDGGSFERLNSHLSSLPGGAKAHRLFYLALPPSVYHHVSTNIRSHCMSHKLASLQSL